MSLALILTTSISMKNLFIIFIIVSVYVPASSMEWKGRRTSTNIEDRRWENKIFSDKYTILLARVVFKSNSNSDLRLSDLKRDEIIMSLYSKLSPFEKRKFNEIIANSLDLDDLSKSKFEFSNKEVTSEHHSDRVMVNYSRALRNSSIIKQTVGNYCLQDDRAECTCPDSCRWGVRVELLTLMEEVEDKKVKSSARSNKTIKASNTFLKQKPPIRREQSSEGVE